MSVAAHTQGTRPSPQASRSALHYLDIGGPSPRFLGRWVPVLGGLRQVLPINHQPGQGRPACEGANEGQARVSHQGLCCPHAGPTLRHTALAPERLGRRSAGLLELSPASHRTASWTAVPLVSPLNRLGEV